MDDKVLAELERIVRADVGWNDDELSLLSRHLPDLLAAAREERRLEMENAGLRAMLAISYGGTGIYTDDGEFQDTRAWPHIDFRRDSLPEIGRKMIERARAVGAKSEVADG